MNPFLENRLVWQDFHSSFIVHARDWLNAQLGQNCFAKVEVRLHAAEFEKHLSLEIHHRNDRRLVTVIELLCPSHKRHSLDRDDYLAQRREAVANRINFVEIDLCRGGKRPHPPQLPDCDYYVWLHPACERVNLWPIKVRDPLPPIPIPLLDGDQPAKLDLKAVLGRTYDAAGYGKFIYESQPERPPTAEQKVWAAALIPAESER